MWAHPLSPRNNDAQFWNRHGRISWTCCHCHIHWQCSMGYSLIIPHSIESLTRCSNLWTWYALWHKFIADWKQIGEFRQRTTDCSNKHEFKTRVDFDYKVGDKILIRKDGILRKAESIWRKGPWTITTVHTNGTIRNQCGTKSERIHIRRVTPFSEELLI
jgi:hypothetical protein